MNEESPLTFPCTFPVKAMGKSSPELDLIVIEIVRRHSPNLGEGALKSRASKGGNYTAITVMVEAQSRQQLDAIYLDLNRSPHILMTL